MEPTEEEKPGKKGWVTPPLFKNKVKPTPIGHGKPVHKPAKLIYKDEVTQKFGQEYNKVYIDEAAHPQSVLRVRNERGHELWMAPRGPNEMWMDKEKRSKLYSKSFYKSGLLTTAFIFLGLTVFLVYSFILTKYKWPFHFMNRIFDKLLFETSERYFLVYGGLILALHPLFVGTWIFVATFCFKRRFLRMYFERSIYFGFINVTYIILSIVFVIALTTDDIKITLRYYLETYNNSTVAQRYWAVLQQQQECCGIRSPEDWFEQYQPPKPYRYHILPKEHQGIVPPSCCIVYRREFERGVVLKPLSYDEQISDCRRNPRYDNPKYIKIWKDGCLIKLSALLTTFITGFILMESLTLLLIGISAFLARKYYIVSEIEKGDEEFDHTCKQSLVNAMCLGHCIKLKKGDDEEKFVLVQDLGTRARRDSSTIAFTWRRSLVKVQSEALKAQEQLKKQEQPSSAAKN